MAVSKFSWSIIPYGTLPVPTLSYNGNTRSPLIFSMVMPNSNRREVVKYACVIIYGSIKLFLTNRKCVFVGCQCECGSSRGGGRVERGGRAGGGGGGVEGASTAKVLDLCRTDAVTKIG